MAYPWYEYVKGSSLEQGDFIPKCPIIIPPKNISEGANEEVEIRIIDSIVLSQSCDLVNNKLEIVLVCPYYDLKEFLKGLGPERTSTKKAKVKTIEDLKKGHLPSYHLLDKDPDFEDSDYITVDFKNVYGIHRESLLEMTKGIESRKRLLPPYREHLSQAFARYFMRVGLPQDIDVQIDY